MKGKGNILTVIESTIGSIFGGFVCDEFGHDGEDGSTRSWIEGDSTNFIFALKGATPELTPVKLYRSDGNGVNVSGCGLHLGGKSY